MKRVSFEVAKAIKEAGYPQGWNSEVYYSLEDEGEYGYKIGDEVSVDQMYKKSLTSVAAPTYIDVWLWLWREKKMYLELSISIEKIARCGIHNERMLPIMGKEDNDPEEAIVAAIDYLIEHNLIEVII